MEFFKRRFLINTPINRSYGANRLIFGRQPPVFPRDGNGERKRIE